MKAYLFIDSIHKSVMMIVAASSRDACILCGEKTDIIKDKYILVGSVNCTEGKLYAHLLLWSLENTIVNSYEKD